MLCPRCNVKMDQAHDTDLHICPRCLMLAYPGSPYWDDSDAEYRQFCVRGVELDTIRRL